MFYKSNKNKSNIQICLSDLLHATEHVKNDRSFINPLKYWKTWGLSAPDSFKTRYHCPHDFSVGKKMVFGPSPIYVTNLFIFVCSKRQIT